MAATTEKGEMTDKIDWANAPEGATQPKRLTQAVFNGLPSEYRWAVVNKYGGASCYTSRPELLSTNGEVYWDLDLDNARKSINNGYDATDWQNSLIERRESITDVARSIEAARVEERKHGHYFKDVSNVAQIDVYSVLRLFEVTDPCLQHIVKKALCAGKRGAKDFAKDVQEIADTAARLIELEQGK